MPSAPASHNVEQHVVQPPPHLQQQQGGEEEKSTSGGLRTVHASLSSTPSAASHPPSRRKVKDGMNVSSLSYSRGCAHPPPHLSSESFSCLLPSPVATPLFHVAWYRKDCYLQTKQTEKNKRMMQGSSSDSFRGSATRSSRSRSRGSEISTPSPHYSSSEDDGEVGGGVMTSATTSHVRMKKTTFAAKAAAILGRGFKKKEKITADGLDASAVVELEEADEVNRLTPTISFSLSSQQDVVSEDRMDPLAPKGSAIPVDDRGRGIHEEFPPHPHHHKVLRQESVNSGVRENKKEWAESNSLMQDPLRGLSPLLSAAEEDVSADLPPRLHSTSTGIEVTSSTDFLSPPPPFVLPNNTAKKNGFIAAIPKLVASCEKQEINLSFSSSTSSKKRSKHIGGLNEEGGRNGKVESMTNRYESFRKKREEDQKQEQDPSHLSVSSLHHTDRDPTKGDNLGSTNWTEESSHALLVRKEHENHRRISLVSTEDLLGSVSPSCLSTTRQRKVGAHHSSSDMHSETHGRKKSTTTITTSRHGVSPRSSLSTTSAGRATLSLHWSLVVLLLLSSLCTSFSFATLSILMNKEMAYDGVAVTKFWLVVSFAYWSEPVMGLIADHVVLFGERRRPLLVLSCLGNAVIHALFGTVYSITRSFRIFLIASFISQMLLVCKYVSLSGILVNVGYVEGESPKESAVRISFIQSKARTWRCIGMFSGAILQTLLFACFSAQIMLGLTAVLFTMLVFPILTASHKYFAPPLSPPPSPLTRCGGGRASPVMSELSHVSNGSFPSDTYTKEKGRKLGLLKSLKRRICRRTGGGYTSTSRVNTGDGCRCSLVCLFVIFYTMMPNSTMVYQNYLFSYEYSAWYYAALNCVGYLGNTVGSHLLSLWIDHFMRKDAKGKGERCSTCFIFVLGSLSWALGYLTNIMVCTGFIEHTLHFPLSVFLPLDVFMSSIFEVWADAPVALSSTKHAPQGMELLWTQFFSVASMAGRSLSSALTLGLLRVQVLHDSLWRLTVCSILCRLVVVPFALFLPNREHASPDEVTLLLGTSSGSCGSSDHH